VRNVGGNYALKIARPDLPRERLDRFRREREFLYEADHPAILPCYAYDDYDDSPFMIVEYLPNTFEQMVISDKLSLAEKVNYATQLVSAVAHIHNLDDPIIHRDIKPSNILVRQNTAFLGDFGMMKRISSDPEDDDMRASKGSVETAVPWKYPTPDLIEYEDGGELGTESDVFQLGLVLTELFTGTGQIPIQGLEGRESGEPVRTEEIENVPGTDYGDDITELLRQMLREDRKRRTSAIGVLSKWTKILRDVTVQDRRLNGRTL
jgi:serine/threonine protein kinase